MPWKDVAAPPAGAPGAAALPTRAKAKRIIPGSEYWKARKTSAAREYAEVLGVVAIVAVVGWSAPVSYHVFGYLYLLMVIALSLRVGRWPVLVAAVVSALTWNFVFMPPRMSFSVLDVDDTLMLGSYFFAALIGGQLTARIRAQERHERQREQRATAFLHLTRALAEARTMDAAAAAALRQADDLFSARTALLLPDENGSLTAHPAGTFRLGEQERAVAAVAWARGQPAGRGTEILPGDGLYLPLLRAGQALGVFAVQLPPELTELSTAQRDLIEGFAAQIALLVEHEQLRAAGEREKLLEESDRLHRTLLDSVSHELKTPLAVLRSAGEKLTTDDPDRRVNLAGEIRTATRRLDHLVANLLNQTRLETGRLEAQLDWCDVRDLIGAARRAAGDAVAARTLKIEVPPDMPLFLADAVLMEHVMANLLFNAALHTPIGTTIRVTAGLDEEHRCVRLEVADNGPGIPAEINATLFQKFQRGPAARAGGLGLGLSIVRGFMEAQHGQVSAGRSPEGGALFTLQLPYAPHGAVPGDET
ncbi:MAG: DUF4118 domain-containing protein [Verrucomicrobia bacterium]|nr:DUF4118 domain-containing protein [Verrucomicrobiota bacterium]